MILFYIDEGGTGWKDKQTDFFFLCSFAIHSSNYWQMEQNIRTLKQSFFSDGKLEKWELKGHYIWQGKDKFKKARPIYRNRVFLEVSQTISQLPGNIIGIQVNKKLLSESNKSIKNDNDLYKFTFYKLLKYLDSFLESRQ